MKPKASIQSGYSVALAATLWLATLARADTSAFALGGALTNQPINFTGTRGWTFAQSGASDPIAITRLGVFDSDGNGLINPHMIGLWNADGTLLAAALVPAGTAAILVDGYRYVSIPQVICIPGSISAIGAFYSVGDADALLIPQPSISPQTQTWLFAPGIAVPTGPTGAGRLGLGSALDFPSFQPGSPCEGCAPYTLFEPNFQFSVIPEPSVPLLFVPSLLYLSLRRHSLRKLHG